MQRGCVYFLMAWLTALATLFLTAHAYSQSIDSLDGIVQTRHKLDLNNDHWYSDPTLMAGFKSNNNFGRFSQNLQNLKTRDELFLGARNSKGWGIYALVSASFGSLGASPNSPSSGSSPNMAFSKHRLDAGDSGGLPPSPADLSGASTAAIRTGLQDPSLAIIHPLYDNGTITVSGQFKESFPVTSFSQSTNSFVQTYDSIFVWHVKKGLNFDNVLDFRYFSRSAYIAPMDSFFASGIITSLNQRLSKLWKIGGGQRTQYEFHETSPTGSAAELFMLADFNISPTVFLGPRVHFPIASQNKLTSDAPTNPSLSNVSAELYFQAAL